MRYPRLNLHWLDFVAAFFIHLNQYKSGLNKETLHKSTRQRICNKDKHNSRITMLIKIQ